MVKIKSMKQLGLLVLLSQTVIGFMVVFYGTMYSRIDTFGAEEMLRYIQEENPSYYSQLTSEEDPSHLREFNKHYTHRGNRKIVVTGLYFLFISGNAAILMVLHEVREMMKQKKEAPAEEGDEGEDSESGGEEEDDDESF